MCHGIFGSRHTWLAALGPMMVAASLAAQNTTTPQTQKRFKSAEEAVQNVIKAAKAKRNPVAVG